MKIYKYFLKRSSLLITLVLITGCVGYNVNPILLNNAKSIGVAPIVNTTSEPALEQKLTQALRSFIQFDGRYTLEDITNADLIIEINLTNYQNNPIAFQTDSLEIRPEQYRQRITASTTLREASSGKIIAQATNYGESIFNFEYDLANSKRNSYLEASNELARMIFTDLFEQW